MPFSIEDNHTIEVLREQKLYGATTILSTFRNKNWTLSRVKTVLSKIDATGSVERCSGSGRPRTARSPDMISDVQDLVLSGSEPRRLRGVGNPTRACVQASTDHGHGRAASVSRRNGTASGPGSDWQCHQWMAQVTDSLRCSRRRTFWRFTLNITAFVHILITMF